MALVAVLAGCDSTEVSNLIAPDDGGRQSMTLVTSPVTVQAMTAGPNGEILQQAPVYTACGSGTIEVYGGQWQVSVPWVKSCIDISNYTPYNGGTVDVWLVQGGTQTHLGHFEANWSKLEFSNLPAGSTLRMVAYPNFDPAPGVRFNSWTGAHGYSTNAELFAAVWGGEEFLAELQMPNGGNGGGGGEPPGCIICP